MNPSLHWAHNFTVTDDDLEFLSGLLLERETPLKTDELARALIEQRLSTEAQDLADRYEGVRVYNPALTYQVGQKVLFPALDFAIGTVDTVRSGENPEYGNFSVIHVQFEDDGVEAREYAAEYPAHKLAQDDDGASNLPGANTFTVDDILASEHDFILEQLDEQLRANPELVAMGGRWFPRDLLLDVNAGHLNLAEAILDINAGLPMTTEQMLDDIGGIGRSSRELQIFSLNYALNQDRRFDEVGPVDTVLWYLQRGEPAEVQNTPAMLRYTPTEYEAALLTPEMQVLEAEIDDEWSAVRDADTPTDNVMVTLNYPHRRAGTLPLNAKMRQIFPTARRTPRIYVTLVDGQDGEEFPGWVVRQDRYVYGLSEFYRKHKMPVGAILHVRRDKAPGRIVIDFGAHRARTEYVPIITPKNGQMAFEYDKRLIGADYDEQMLLGAEDLPAVDALFQDAQRTRKTLSAILHNLVTELSRTSPQGTVHGKTLYSATNVLRRCPPGPIFAALAANLDFEYVGSNFWKLSPR